MKKTIGFIFLLSMVIILAACSSNDNENNQAEGNNESNQQSEKTHEITGMTYIFGNPPPSNGPGLEAINERFNVDYQVVKVPEGDYIEKVTAVVTGGDIPDMLGFRPTTQTLFQRWADQGAFLPLDDYIDQYETFKMVPEEVWDQLRVNGKIYGIPSYASREGSSFLIRQDWLDQLGLDMPTSWEELTEVAIAFTKEDPDNNGEDDTYGIAIGQGINPDYGSLGPYWLASNWYHKDDEGNFLPGIITDARKEVIEVFHNLYNEKAITQDFAVLNWADTNNEFYSGKAGIFLQALSGMSQDYMESLLEINPEATFSTIPPFESPDGHQGFLAGTGYTRFNAFSAELADDPDKLHKVLEMHDFSRKYHQEIGSANEDYDWMNGGEGIAYEIENDRLVQLKPGEGYAPSEYFQDSTAWKPDEVDPEYHKSYQNPELIQLTKDLYELNQQMEHYIAPHNGIISDMQAERGADLNTFLINEQTKMIVGQRPIEEWDDMVQEWMTKGGDVLIQEINEGIQERGTTELNWK